MQSATEKRLLLLLPRVHSVAAAVLLQFPVPTLLEGFNSKQTAPEQIFLSAPLAICRYKELPHALLSFGLCVLGVLTG